MGAAAAATAGVFTSSSTFFTAAAVTSTALDSSTFAAGIPNANLGASFASPGFDAPNDNPVAIVGASVFSSVDALLVVCGTPKLNLLLLLTVPKEYCGNFSAGPPGFAWSQHAHLLLFCSFLVIHVEHSHLACCALSSFPNPSSFESAFLQPNENVGAPTDGANGFELLILVGSGFFTAPAPLPLPGFGLSQQRHLTAVESLRVMHSLHSHLSAFCAAISALKPSSAGFTAADSTGTKGFVVVVGISLGVVHARHLRSVSLFRTMHTEQLQVLAGALNLSPKDVVVFGASPRASSTLPFFSSTGFFASVAAAAAATGDVIVVVKPSFTFAVSGLNLKAPNIGLGVAVVGDDDDNFSPSDAAEGALKMKFILAGDPSTAASVVDVFNAIGAANWKSPRLATIEGAGGEDGVADEVGTLFGVAPFSIAPNAIELDFEVFAKLLFT